MCIDLFADDDLKQIAEVIRIEDYPAEILIAETSFPPAPFLYTGGLENHPPVVAELSKRRQLLGNNAETLTAVRNPQLLADCLQDAGLPALEVHHSKNPPAADGSWLLKPTNGAGGNGIEVWNDAAGNSPTLQKPHYFQRFVAGDSYSALFLETRLLGVTKQFVGLATVHAGPFSYCGSVGPIELSETQTSQLNNVGAAVTKRFGLKGLFGIDFISSNEYFWPTEINPRYPASAEVFDFAWGISTIGLHCRAFDEGIEKITIPIPDTPKFVGKQILFAADNVTIPDLNHLKSNTKSNEPPFVADIPATGTKIEKAHPVCTILASGKTLEACQQQLENRRDLVTSLIAEPSS